MLISAVKHKRRPWTHNQLRSFSVAKQKDHSRIEQCCVGWTAIRFNTADTGLDLFLV